MSALEKWAIENRERMTEKDDAAAEKAEKMKGFSFVHKHACGSPGRPLCLSALWIISSRLLCVCS